MCDKLLASDERLLNRSVLDLTDEPIQSAVEEAKQLSLGGQRKISLYVTLPYHASVPNWSY